MTAYGHHVTALECHAAVTGKRTQWLQSLCSVMEPIACRSCRYSGVVGKGEIVEVELAVVAIVAAVVRDLRVLQSFVGGATLGTLEFNN